MSAAEEASQLSATATWVLGLSSGLVGAVIGAMLGAVLSGRYTRDATDRTLAARREELDQEDARRREQDERERNERRADAERQRLRLLKALLIEVKENREGLVGDSPAEEEFSIGFVVVRDVWDRVRAEASFFPDEVVDSATAAYARAARLEAAMVVARSAMAAGTPLPPADFVEFVRLNAIATIGAFDGLTNVIENWLQQLADPETISEGWQEPFGPGGG
jgi:hypothetical protein